MPPRPATPASMSDFTPRHDWQHAEAEALFARQEADAL